MQSVLVICSIVPVGVTACLQVPDLRETPETLVLDQGISENDSGEVISDASVICESRATNHDGTCLDESIPTPDLSTDCASDGAMCQDAEISTDMNVQDMNVQDMQVVEPEEFSNTRWIRMRRDDYLEADGTLMNSSLGRLSNGAGAEDAWTISVYIKTGDHADEQPILYYGSDLPDRHHFAIYWSGKTGENRKRLIFKYGIASNHLEFQTPIGSIQDQSMWYHLMTTYDGGETGSQNSQLDRALSRFKIFINGAQSSLTTSHSNYGIDTGLQGDYLRIGKHPTEDFDLSGFKVDELAIWDSDQSLKVLDIYNNGAPTDLSQLEYPPAHWWRFGDGEMDRYPMLQDQMGEAHFTMYNMSVDDIVSSSP